VVKPGRGDWVVSATDQILAKAKQDKADIPLVCATGISPSGPIHLGNLREIMVPHFVADELRRQGHDLRHILSWDDYDRLRKVPAGIPELFAEHIGQPLTSVPESLPTECACSRCSQPAPAPRSWRRSATTLSWPPLILG
jgi:lysyl-tRNA synthetase class 1